MSLPTSTFVGLRSAEPMRAPNSPSQPDTNASKLLVRSRTLPLYPSPSQIYFIHVSIHTKQCIATRRAQEDMVANTNTSHRRLDFNPIQTSLFSSTAVSCEIFVWELKDPGKSYSPGTRGHKARSRSRGTTTCTTRSLRAAALSTINVAGARSPRSPTVVGRARWAACRRSAVNARRRAGGGDECRMLRYFCMSC